MRFVTMLVLAALLPAATAQASLMVNPRYVTLRTRAGGSTSQTVFVRNLGPDEVNVNVYDSCGADFRVFDNCFGLLSPNFSCTVRIQFQPRDRGTRSCSVQINAFGGGGSAFIRVQGTGY